MMRASCLILLLAGLLCTTPARATAADAPAPPAWSLIPQPAQLQPTAGAVDVADGARVVVRAKDPQARTIAKRFVALVASTRHLQLKLDTVAHAKASAVIAFDLDPTAKATGDAGYHIHIDDGHIRVSARTPRGLFYGSVTLWQLLTPDAAHGAVRVPDGDINDHPRFAWRGLMLDSARHFQSVANIKRLIAWMALHKLNVLHWHLTDDQGWRLQIKRYPKLTSIGGCRKPVGPDAALTGGPDKPYCGYYTQDQVRDLVRYAQARFITIVPEIEMPGHAQAAIAAYPDLGVTGKRPPVSTDWGINTWLYAPDAHSIHFLENVLDEVMQLFPSRYIHIGGDEAAKDQWQASAKVQAHMRKLGLKDDNAMQGWMVAQIGTYLAAHHRRLLGWDEILDGGVPPDATVMSWRGIKGAIVAANQDHDVVLSPSPTLYLDNLQSDGHDEPPGRPQVQSLKTIYDFNPVPTGIDAAKAKHILGLQANLWTEYMPTFARDQHAIFPRLAALAEVAWSPANAHDWSGFLDRLPAQLARYRSLGIAYGDGAYAPRFALGKSADDKIAVILSNQVQRGVIRYTTDGSAPATQSSRYAKPLTFPAQTNTTLRAATFSAAGFMLATPRTQQVDTAALLIRNSDQLTPCTSTIVLRIEDDRPLEGPRPVYKLNIADTCWLWKQAPLDGMRHIAVTVGNMPWNYQLWNDTSAVVARPAHTSAGELEIHVDGCDGSRVTDLPLTQAADNPEQTTLHAALPALSGKHDLCIFATGDPRKGRLWAVGKVQLSP